MEKSPKNKPAIHSGLGLKVSSKECHFRMEGIVGDNINLRRGQQEERFQSSYADRSTAFRSTQIRNFDIFPAFVRRRHIN